MIVRIAMLFVCAVLSCLSCSEVRQPVLTATASTHELAPGKTAQITVTRQFPRGPLETVTNEVQYAVTDRDVIDVSATGVVTPGNEAGTADVRVSDPDDGASTTIRFTVSTARIVSIRMVPDSPVFMPSGEQRRFEAIATLSDGTEESVTSNLVWQSSYLAVATVGQTQGDIGNVTAVRAGESTITATDTLTNLQARNVVIVTGNPPVLAAITITPNPATVAVGATFPLTAVGIYSDGTTQDVTHSATWSSTDTTKATVDANGIITGISAGSVTITAAEKSGLMKGSTALTIQ